MSLTNEATDGNASTAVSSVFMTGFNHYVNLVSNESRNEANSPDGAFKRFLSIMNQKDLLSNKWNYNIAKTAPMSPGVHVILGLPRSGKTTLATIITRSLNGAYYSLDEPISSSDNYCFYGKEGLIAILATVIADDTALHCIDSVRTLINALGGTTGKGGISTVYKEVITVLNNLAVKLNKSIILVVTSDADLTLDLRASSSSLTIVDDFKYVSQARDDAYPGSKYQVLSKPVKETLLAAGLTCEDDLFKDAAINSYDLTRMALSGSVDALQFLKQKLSYDAFYKTVVLSRSSSVIPMPKRQFEDVTDVNKIGVMEINSDSIIY